MIASQEPSVTYSDADKPAASEVIALFRAAGLNGPLDEPGFYLKNDFRKADGCYVRMRKR